MRQGEVTGTRDIGQLETLSCTDRRPADRAGPFELRFGPVLNKEVIGVWLRVASAARARWRDNRVAHMETRYLST